MTGCEWPDIPLPQDSRRAANADASYIEMYELAKRYELEIYNLREALQKIQGANWQRAINEEWKELCGDLQAIASKALEYRGTR